MRNRILAIAGIALGVIALLALTGYAFANAPEKGSMGVWGYVASEKFASINLNEEQIGADTLVVRRVKAPADAWIVVHTDDDGMPGERVGLKHISMGESLNVEVPLKDVTSEKVIVAVHADKATANTFDFDMENKEQSPDRPFFVDEKELAKVVTVRSFGVPAEEGQASIEVSDQPGASDSITVDKAVAPTGAWIVVHLNDDGMPGERVGFTQIPAGESRDVVVKLATGVELTDDLLLAVHADRGVAGTLEFDMENKLGSPDQPFFVNGKEVATKASVR